MDNHTHRHATQTPQNPTPQSPSTALTFHRRPCCEEPVGAPAPQLQTPQPDLRAAVRWLAALAGGRSALGRGQRMQRRRNIIRCDVCDDDDTTVAYPTTDLHLHRYNTQANEVAVGPLQARYDGIHRSHTTILGPNVRLGPKVQSPTDRCSLDKAVAAGTSQQRAMKNWSGSVTLLALS